MQKLKGGSCESPFIYLRNYDETMKNDDAMNGD
jgi:hypothetical protein